jgi:membrane protease YdiL (CAAX protease family)
MEDKPEGPRRVFMTYVTAVAGIIVTTVAAVAILHSADPEASELALLHTLPWLLASSLAASTALILTLLLFVRPLDPVRLRLLPGVETGPVLAVMVVGLLALGQALDSSTALLGFGDNGLMKIARQVLERTRGPELFAAVLVFGLGAGVAEEIFFRGYMQARLREHWSARAAVLASSSTFAILHYDDSPVRVVLVFAIGLYLGFVAEISGSTLPSIVCHVTNNVVYTLQTALGFAVLSREANLVAAAAGALVFVACLLWLRRAVLPTAAS